MKIAPFAFGALFLCMANAQAQSVTLYGLADMNIEFANHVGKIPAQANGFNPGPGESVYRMNSGGLSGSRWGIRGTEELGGGLKSIFVLESGFNLDNGTSAQGGRLFGRQAYIGLQSSYGQLTFGRQYTAIFDALASFAPLAYAPQYEPLAVMIGANYREDNMLKYTGRFGPVTALAHWSFGTGVALPPTTGAPMVVGGNGEVPGNFRRDTAFGAALVYNAGPAGLAIAYDQLNPTIMPTASSAGAGSGTFAKASVAGSYSIGAAKLMAGYRWGKNRDQNDNLLLRDDLYWFGGSFQVTPAVELSLEYTYDNVKSQFGSSTVPNPWQVAFMGRYTLSKRTDVYLTTAYAKNAGVGLESAAIFSANSLALGNNYVLGAGHTSMVGVAAGIRHRF